jgi:hypothetical protein
MAFDSNSFLSLEVHIVQHLIHHFPFSNGIGRLKQPVSQGGFTVVDMGDNTKVPDLLHG